jgi:hypothetical protein
MSVSTPHLNLVRAFMQPETKVVGLRWIEIKWYRSPSCYTADQLIFDKTDTLDVLSSR